MDCGSGERAKNIPVSTDTHNIRKQVPKRSRKKTKQNRKLKACITISSEDNTDEKEWGVKTTKYWKRGPQTADESEINMCTLYTRDVIATPNCYQHHNYIDSLCTGY